MPTILNWGKNISILRKPWRAYGRRGGQFISIGYFETKERAAMAYNEFAKRVYGPSAYLNPEPASE